MGPTVVLTTAIPLAIHSEFNGKIMSYSTTQIQYIYLRHIHYPLKNDIFRSSRPSLGVHIVQAGVQGKISCFCEISQVSRIRKNVIKTSRWLQLRHPKYPVSRPDVNY
jgi:hypothetical protein